MLALGVAVIDNAAHLGGLAGGVALGWMLVPRTGDPQQTGTWVVILGRVAMLAIAGVVLATGAVLLRL